MAIEKVKVVKIDTDPAQTSVKELRSQLKELKNTMLSCEQGTEEYNQALVQAAEIQHTLKEQMEQVNAAAMDFGQIVSNSTKALGGIVGGFQAATAVMNLFGTENEDVIKTLKTMQQLMSITQALPAIDNGVKAFKALGIAIKGASTAFKGLSAAAISTGIGALVVALGALIANWDKVTEAVKKFTDANYAAKKSQEELANKIKETEREIATAKGKLEEWEEAQDVSKMNKKAKAAFEEYKKQLEGVQLQLVVLRAEEKKAEEEMIAGAARRAKGDEWKKLKQNYNEAAELRKQAQQQIESLEDALHNLRESESSYTKDIESGNNATKERVKTLEELNAEIAKWLEMQMKEGLTHNEVEDAIRKRREEMQKLREAEEEDEDLSNIENYINRVYGTVQSLQQAFGQSNEERYAQEMSALESWKNMELVKFKDNEEKKLEILKQYSQLRSALETEQTQLTLQRYAAAANGIGQIFSSLGDLMAEGSEEQKALQIMGATINMLGGITAAISGAFTTHSGPWDIALAAIQATAIAASGAATIAQMTKTNENNATSMSKATPNTSAINSIIAPVQYTQDVQGASIEGAIKDSKVYVTETDITDTQKKVDVAESEAKF